MFFVWATPISLVMKLAGKSRLVEKSRLDAAFLCCLDARSQLEDKLGVSVLLKFFWWELAGGYWGLAPV